MHNSVVANDCSVVKMLVANDVVNIVLDMPQIDYRQLGYLLGLMGQAQRGETLDLAQIGAHSTPPLLHGLKPMD